MPITYHLIEENRVQHMVIAEPWDVEELLPVIRAIVSDLEKQSKTTHILVDIRQAKHVPIGVLGRIRHEMRPGHPRRGHTVIVGGVVLFREVFRYLASYYRYDRLKMFGDEDEAFAYVRKLIADEKMP